MLVNSQYFIDKAENILDRMGEIHPEIKNDQYLVDVIYVGLKEVAKDQRNVCVEAVAKDCLADNLPEDFPFHQVESIIQNANTIIKKE